jgi:PAS domain S-box-containing protein
MSASVPTLPGTRPTRLNRLQLGVAMLGVFVILVFAGSSAYDAWRSYGRSVLATDREIGNMAQALAEQTVWTLQTVDLMLLDTSQWYRSDSHDIPPNRLEAALAARTAGIQPVRNVAIIDAQGNQLYRSRDTHTPKLNVSDRSYFIAQRDNPAAGLYVSEPLETRSEGRAAVVLSRRLDDDHGNFAGVVTANIDLEELKKFYRAVNVDAGTALQLVSDDGGLLVRNPPTPAALGRKFPALAAAGKEPGSRLVDPIDGHEVFIAIAPIRNAPLKLAVTRDVALALKPWRDETIRVAARTLIITFLGVLTIATLLRQLRRVAAGEKALRESEERYALAMEGANEGHWDWDIAADRLFLSSKMKMLGGLSPESEIASRNDWFTQIIMHPDDKPRFEAAVNDHFQGRTARFECDYRVRQPSGDWHWLLSRGRLSLDSAGKPSRFVGSAIDITAEKQAQSERDRLEAQLRQSQKMEAVGTLAGGIAHDFNNILGAILGYGELAAEHAAENTDMRRYLGNVMNAAERAKLLVERILGFSRSGLGDRTAVNVQSVVRETLELLEASLPAAIRLDRELDAGDSAVMGDPTYLHQLTMNLCTNAVQAMDRGGTLRVGLERCEVHEGRTLLRGSLAALPYLRLTVSDQGGGIPPAILERMFDPFFTTKEVGEGTGLGLSLVHGIVTDLGGAIDVATRIGAGTTFEIWLPAIGGTLMPEAERSVTLPRGRGEAVMIVDDERSLVALAEETIAGLGYEPVGFESSVAALEAFQVSPQRFDLVLTDESMPDLIGTQLAREIRRIRPSIPIILMSGWGGAQLVKRAAELGVDEVLRKPLHRRELAESLSRVLGTLA